MSEKLFLKPLPEPAPKVLGHGPTSRGAATDEWCIVIDGRTVRASVQSPENPERTCRFFIGKFKSARAAELIAETVRGWFVEARKRDTREPAQYRFRLDMAAEYLHEEREHKAPETDPAGLEGTPWSLVKFDERKFTVRDSKGRCVGYICPNGGDDEPKPEEVARGIVAAVNFYPGLLKAAAELAAWQGELPQSMPAGARRALTWLVQQVRAAEKEVKVT